MIIKGIAASRLSKINELYPTVGMQTFGETIDANFGQLPFKYNIEKDHEVSLFFFKKYLKKL